MMLLGNGHPVRLSYGYGVRIYKNPLRDMHLEGPAATLAS